jgi:hypothetical protein
MHANKNSSVAVVGFIFVENFAEQQLLHPRRVQQLGPSAKAIAAGCYRWTLFETVYTA